MKPLVIYHSNCADGFTAAWAVHRALDADFHPGVYSAPPPNVTGRDVILVDFSYPRAVMLQLQQVARSILVLDHHKSADEDLPANDLTAADQLTVLRLSFDMYGDLITPWRHFQACVLQDQCEGVNKAIVYALFDQQKSGAGIAWDFFHPGVARPALVNHVEDRDLWRFALPGTREIQAAVFSYPYKFDVWDVLAYTPIDSLRGQGVAIERKHHKDVKELVQVMKRRMVIGDYDVPAASIPYTLTSDAGHLMAQGEPFAACYWDTPTGRVFSLRSSDDGLDVSQVARLYGGGGHAKASGFTVPRDHELARS
ncbi:hypothetical protein LL972_21335 [Xanthomonas campestris pv. asclepiadis]|uniref:hypothetical protein n=1 Tax=Xanthomonas campestris TaxID=339 RepID=UPI001E5E0554|nr:hypothetical protein [Xanthomonas campestris]MCC4618491.1 hypothetical protein [Xanthomonas campestris pv. asclepiadis]